MSHFSGITDLPRSIETGEGGAGGEVAAPLPRFLLASIFDELKKNSVKVKNSTKLQN